jgi:uncharacterized protein YjiK
MKKSFLSILIIACGITACSSQREPAFEIGGYDYSKRTVFELEKPLQEISGLAYDKLRDEFLAVNDEQGKIFVLDSKTFNIIRKLHFDEKGDYEEIQMMDSMIYVLRSDGNIFKMKYTGDSISDILMIEYKSTKGEFESFYVLQDKNQLALIPKNSKLSFSNKETKSQKQDATTGEPVEHGNERIDWNKLSGVSVLHPSAVAIHPLTKEIYVVASIEKLLLVLDAQYNILAEYALPASTFQQPEGITFDKEGNLYISNEGNETKPTIIQIPIKKSN